MAAAAANQVRLVQTDIKDKKQQLLLLNIVRHAF
jgi:hypothetical protein